MQIGILFYFFIINFFFKKKIKISPLGCCVLIKAFERDFTFYKFNQFCVAMSLDN